LDSEITLNHGENGRLEIPATILIYLLFFELIIAGWWFAYIPTAKEVLTCSYAAEFIAKSLSLYS
jgi:hypothetical protein